MQDLINFADKYLTKLCVETGNRCVGSRGNLLATAFFAQELEKLGWNTWQQPFEAFDWHHSGASLLIGNTEYEVFPSPYTLDAQVTASMVDVSNLQELQDVDARGKILVVRGELAKEQLMPKNFVFYNPKEHQRLVSLLENSEAAALIFIVDKKSIHEGGEYPFPIIEDGDFEIPSVFMAWEEGKELLSHLAAKAKLAINATRTPSKGFNVIGHKGDPAAGQITVTAHIDSKKGTPGAIDNATGVVCLLLLARLLADHEGHPLVELVALNGEDYYSVPGQMTYVNQSADRIKNTLLNINIDGAGLKTGATSFSLFNLPPELLEAAQKVIATFDGIVEGKPWVQGDHSIFLQLGIPAIAISSAWLIEHLASQDITHTPKDDVHIVDTRKLAEAALALHDLIRRLAR